MFCEGQLLPISENETLFQLIGTTYGGDGESTFALPDLRGPAPDPPGQRLHPRRDRRGGGDHADDPADPGPHPPAARRAPRRGSQNSPQATSCAELADDRPVPRDVADRGRRRRTRSGRSAAASRTRTSSPTSASTSSSRSSGSSRAPPRRRHGRSLRRRDPHLPVQLRAQGLGVVRRAAPAALAEHRALLAARHHVRRQRQVELRAARPAGPRADAPRPGPGPEPPRPRRDRRQPRR